MKSRQSKRAIAGVLLCAGGLGLALPAPDQERTYIFNAEGCRLETTIFEKPGGVTQGSIVLFHGISANKKIMSYMARGFVEQGLRVFVPDLPGHGRTPGPFSPARAEQCGEALVRELLTRGLLSPERTILAGHSMGGAIAERIAARVPVAGLIALSPAPMRAAHGVTEEKLLYSNPPELPAHSLVMVGSLELESMRLNAADLVSGQNRETSKFLPISGVSHVSILFNGSAMHASEEWAAQVLHMPLTEGLPSRGPLVGALGGFLGILLLAGPFLRELAGKKPPEEAVVDQGGIDEPRLMMEFAAGSVLIVLLLKFLPPLKVIRLFQGDYLAGFLLLFGGLLIVAHWSASRSVLTNSVKHLVTAVFAGLVLLFLATAWFDLTFYEAWLTAAKWARFPFLVVAALPYHFAEETLLGPIASGKRWRRFELAMALRFISWGAMMGGVLLLHSGEILIGLLALYMGTFNLVQRSGMDIVRKETGSATAAAVFGAILLAGFCLVIFPLT